MLSKFLRLCFCAQILKTGRSNVLFGELFSDTFDFGLLAELGRSSFCFFFQYIRASVLCEMFK